MTKSKNGYLSLNWIVATFIFSERFMVQFNNIYVKWIRFLSLIMFRKEERSFDYKKK